MKTETEYELRILEKNLQKQKMISDLEIKHEIQGDTVTEKLEDLQIKIDLTEVLNEDI